MIARCSAGLDVHKATVVCTIVKEDDDGKTKKSTREYLTFRKDLQKLASWLIESDVELGHGKYRDILEDSI